MPRPLKILAPGREPGIRFDATDDSSCRALPRCRSALRLGSRETIFGALILYRPSGAYPTWRPEMVNRSATSQVPPLRD